MPQTLQDMDQDVELQATLARLGSVGQAEMTREEKLQRQRSLDHINAPAFARLVKVRGGAEDAARRAWRKDGAGEGGGGVATRASCVAEQCRLT